MKINMLNAKKIFNFVCINNLFYQFYLFFNGQMENG